MASEGPREDMPRPVDGRDGMGETQVETALSDLTECIARIQALIPTVRPAIDRGTGMAAQGEREGTSVVYGGGPKALASKEQTPAPGERTGHRAPTRAVCSDAARRYDAPERNDAPRRADAPEAAPASSRAPSARDLLLATELSLAGHSEEQIATHLRARLGSDTDLVIAEAFEQHVP